MTFNAPIPLQPALDMLKRRNLLPMQLNSREYQLLLSSAIRQRAVFASQMTAIEPLIELLKITQDAASGKLDAATARLRLVRASAALEEPLDDNRINLMLETNLQIAASIGNVIQGNDPDVINAYPAWEFFRLEERDEPRNWPNRWKIAANMANDTDAINALENFGVMAALKDSAIWSELGSTANFPDALDNDFAPFAWSSGMTQRDFSYEDSIKTGLMNPGDKVEPQEIPDFAANLSSSAPDLSEEFIRAIIDSSAGTLKYENGALVAA
jgi:hypothetical protein